MNEIYLKRVLENVKVSLSDKPKTTFQLFRESGFNGENYVAFQVAMKLLSERGAIKCLGTASSIGYKGHGVQGKSLIYSTADLKPKAEKYQGERTPPKYVKDWRLTMGKVPHFIDPRRDYREHEQLAMMTR
jgi:hypothetical protein